MALQIIDLYGPVNMIKKPDTLLKQDLNGRNALHTAVLNKQKAIVVALLNLDQDTSSLRTSLDCKMKTPQQYDDSNLFGNLFLSLFDCIKLGDFINLKKNFAQQTQTRQTHWLGDSPLHVAVKQKQLEAIQWLISQNESPVQPNRAGKTPQDFCGKIKDEPMRRCIEGLLSK